MQEPNYKEQCAEELKSLLDEGETDMDILFDACGDLDPAELLDMIM